ncbi:MAG: DUF1257 domain-containing protein [Candidatus Sericytochromatia bacterium]|nr:DUF1257 domain-containing protein [Candidatus Tanganyikabacteria bacterium]
MSHYTRIRTRFADREALQKALEDLGFDDVVSGDDPMPLRGYPGAQGQAHVVVRAGEQNQYEFGFLREADGTYVARIEAVDRGKLGAAWLSRLALRYAYHATVSRLHDQGFDVVEERQQDGAIRLLMRRMA